jgi:hypothetical protein
VKGQSGRGQNEVSRRRERTATLIGALRGLCRIPRAAVHVLALLGTAGTSEDAHLRGGRRAILRSCRDPCSTRFLRQRNERPPFRAGPRRGDDNVANALLEGSAVGALALDPSEGEHAARGSPVASHRPRDAGTRQHVLPKGSRPTGTLARTSSLRPTYHRRIRRHSRLSA